jgi:MoaA/NifB/PqqE/SkfB family radical SAM enzyme
MTASDARTYLVPRRPAVVVRGPGDELRILDFSEASVVRATGVLGRETWRLLEDGTAAGPAAAIPPELPLGRALAALSGQPLVPLTPAAALRLDGFELLFVELTGRCDASCVHCYAAAGPEIDAGLDRQTCEAVLRDAAQLGFRIVQFTGGEPLLCPFLPDLVRLAAETGIPRVEIYTNGMRLDDAALDRLAPLDPRLAFSFYSHRPEVHDALTRVPGSHGLTAAAIARAVARGLQVRVSVVVVADNADHVDETLAFVRRLGVKRVGWGPSHAVGRGTLYAGPIRAARELDVPDDVAPGGGRLCVAYDGTVLPCIFNRDEVLGRLAERSLRQIAERPDPPARRDLDPEAFRCDAAARLPCLICRFTGYARRLAAAG